MAARRARARPAAARSRQASDEIREFGVTARTKSTLVFVYNAEAGLFNVLGDMAHKIFSPETYQCNLCALTHTSFGMRKSWKRFLLTLDKLPEFLHADELKERYGKGGVPLPAVFQKKDGGLALLIDAGEINACRTLDDLQQLLTARLLALQR